MRMPGSVRQSGTVDGANAKKTASRAPANRCRRPDHWGLATRCRQRSNTWRFPVTTKHILHGIDDLAEGGSHPSRIDDQFHEVGFAGGARP